MGSTPPPIDKTFTGQFGSILDRITSLERKRFPNLNRGTTAARDSVFDTSTSANQLALANNIQQWFNTDKAWTEAYYMPTGTVGLTAPGLIAGTPAGWYPISGNLPRATLWLITTGISGIAAATQFCLSRTGYVQTPAAGLVNGITYNATPGQLICPTIGLYRIGWAVAQATAASGSLVVGASLNSTTTQGSSGSIYSVNKVFGAVETAANSASYTWNTSPPLYFATSAATDFFQFWFGGGSGASSVVGFGTTYPFMSSNGAQFLSVQYVGPAFTSR
jgi:hypothetical protein